MNRVLRRCYSMLIDLIIYLRRDRPDRDDMDKRMRRASYETDVSRWPLRMTGLLRDRLRRRWLRIKKSK
ncbi:MAG: hypothetical protein ACYTBZ_18345 [Planctomycetota bacterium]|jgi:hypothetical protein